MGGGGKGVRLTQPPQPLPRFSKKESQTGSKRRKVERKCKKERKKIYIRGPVVKNDQTYNFNFSQKSQLKVQTNRTNYT